ncbi:MAG: DUF3656 domain-containing protein [Herbinix sp.]|nr:DUF3656 domain-containing protein [Herbinix sp.]
MSRKLEILAPAGSYEAMKAAMNAGCDAVYIGGSSFGARAFANNLSEDTLLRAIDETHIRDKKLYLTVNTLLKEKELTDRLYSYLEKYYLQGLDAVIVQDVGVMHFIHTNFPDLPIHASTQMTLTMAQGANLLQDCGVTRLVTSRELSLKEIKTIRENTELEIETFVHGALCYCYSGQCLMSSMIGGRSGNRGRCAQPCRMPYQFYSDNKRLSTEQEKYLLSPKDINTIEKLPELVEAGIDSFKIEGRMKRPEYAAAVASMYRKYVDLYLELGKERYRKLITGSEFEKDMILLQDVYNRGGFSEGYGNTYHGKSMMSLNRPNHSGVYIGDVTGVKGGEVSIKLKEMLHAQDILEIRHKEEEGYEFTVKDSHNAGEVITTYVGKRADITSQETKSRSKYTMKTMEPILRVGDLVYRTKNNELLEYLAKKYLAEDQKQGIHGHLTAKLGEKLTLSISFHEFCVTVYQDVVQEAIKQPMSKEKLTAPILKTGDTLYFFEELTVDADDNIFVPVAWLNEIRRDAMNKLEVEVARQYRRRNNSQGIMDGNNSGEALTGKPDISEKAISSNAYLSDSYGQEQARNSFGITVSVQTAQQFEAVMHFNEITSVFVDYDRLEDNHLPEMAETAGKAGKNFYLILPHICRLSLYVRLEKELCEIIDNKWITGFVVKNFEEISLLKSLLIDGKPGKEIILNYNLYIYNKEAKHFWNEKGITHFTAPVELNHQELKLLGMEDCDMVVYGYLPLMVSAQCLFESTGDCKKCRQNHTGYLTDRLGKKFFVQTNCSGCYNMIYNGQALALHKQESEIIGLKPKNIRLDFSIETAAQMKQIIKTFIDTYRYEAKDVAELSDYTTGHFKRGVE